MQVLYLCEHGLSTEKFVFIRDVELQENEHSLLGTLNSLSLHLYLPLSLSNKQNKD